MSNDATAMASLLATIQALETELHHPGACSGPLRLQQLLHEDFCEVGRSGREYDRATVLRFLSEQEVSPPTESSGFALQELAPGMVLLTYRSANRRQDGGLDTYTLRSSLWMQVHGHWQLRYHQGTPAAQHW